MKFLQDDVNKKLHELIKHERAFMNRFNRIDAENEELRELVSKAKYFFDFILHGFVLYKRKLQVW